MKGLVLLCPVLKSGNQRVRKLVAKGVKSSYKTRQNEMQKTPFQFTAFGESVKSKTEKQSYRLWNYWPKVSLMNK